jgi:hypothetical protein
MCRKYVQMVQSFIDLLTNFFAVRGKLEPYI